ncbi:hypothetical protein B0H14DRAFT_2611652 [Mycena olivaceomarginata]|nr:hypothetical protein B0H14DRAFT_2611652 [Mycena olivaceomarginata]
MAIPNEKDKEGPMFLSLAAGFTDCPSRRGDYDKGLPGCGIGLAHAVARGTLGDSLLREASAHPIMTPAYAELLKAWKIALSVEFATDPHGNFGSTSFPNPDVLHAYAHPITSWSANYSPPAYQSWGLAQPKLGRIASFCQLQFGWDAAQVSNKFSKLVYPGIALQSLLKPYDLHVLLEAHVNLGFSSDYSIPRSSVLRVVKERTATQHGTSVKHYQVLGALGDRGIQHTDTGSSMETIPPDAAWRSWASFSSPPALVVRNSSQTKYSHTHLSQRDLSLLKFFKSICEVESLAVLRKFFIMSVSTEEQENVADGEEEEDGDGKSGTSTEAREQGIEGPAEEAAVLAACNRDAGAAAVDHIEREPVQNGAVKFSYSLSEGTVPRDRWNIPGDGTVVLQEEGGWGSAINSAGNIRSPSHVCCAQPPQLVECAMNY